jgi:hypothetical protein
MWPKSKPLPPETAAAAVVVAVAAAVVAVVVVVVVELMVEEVEGYMKGAGRGWGCNSAVDTVLEEDSSNVVQIWAFHHGYWTL